MESKISLTIQRFQGNPAGQRSVVDSMMRALERYSADLEAIVEQRTETIRQTTNNLQDLLYRLFPPAVAAQLANGEVVAPVHYSSVTIAFTDIVGFTDICSTLTPHQVVEMLNNLYVSFDVVIDNHDVYKV